MRNALSIAGRPSDILFPMAVAVRQHAVLRQFLARAIARRYRVSSFGFLWMVLIPLATLGIYTFVFDVIMEGGRLGPGQDRTGFALYLFAGLIVFWLMAEVMTQAVGAVVEHTNLVKKAVFPLEIIALVVVGNALFHTVISTGILLVAVLATTGAVPLTALLLPAVIVPFVLLLAGLAWILAAVGVYFRDLTHIIGLFMTAALFLSPVLYSIDRLAPALRALIMVNPVTFIVIQARRVLLDGVMLDWSGLALYTAVGWLVASLGLAFFRAARKNFADVL